MALPTFFARVADSLRPVTEVDPDALRNKLDHLRIRVELAVDDPAARSAFMLAANLAARLYPRIELAVSPKLSDATSLVSQARDAVLAINPLAEVEPPLTRAPSTTSVTVPQQGGPRVVSLYLGLSDAAGELTTESENDVAVDAHGWNVLVDPNATHRVDDPGHPLAWLAAAAIGMAEVFRCVFAEELGERGRTASQPGGFNLLNSVPVDLAAPLPARSTRPTPSESVDIGEVHLIGAGAIGQATAYALAHLNIVGCIHVIDPETITLSNLQRYLLTDADSVGAVKVELVSEVLTHGSFLTRHFNTSDGSAGALEVRPFSGRWGDLPTHLNAGQVLVALDTARDRITVAGTLPHHAYNAWTQVADLGWSRHERFGERPCLACLYYPNRARPSEHELISQALNQHPLRVLAYLIYGIPIGFPLPGMPAVADLPPPDESQRWSEVSLLEDLISARVVGDGQRDQWGNSTVGALYRDGICAGGLLPVGDLPGDVLVPLAHQSALAGILLAAELIWSRTPDLANQRDSSIEHRYDVLRGFPQVAARPRELTSNCICGDPFYLAAMSRQEELTPEAP